MFLKSSLIKDIHGNSNEHIINWVEERNSIINVNLDRIPLKEIDNWHFNIEKDNFSHVTGRFFSIEGINIQTNWGERSTWNQPIINQPEIGFLGFITKEIEGILHFLVQAKIEPGNVNNVQLSPTLQATKSNYTQVHGGKKPTYLEYFQDKSNTILLDQLQSEQGSRFLKKRNRNIIIKVDDDIPVYDDYKWMTLGQIKYIMTFDNKVNMDTRTVISGIPFGLINSSTEEIDSEQDIMLSPIGRKMILSEMESVDALYTIDDIISWFTELKTYYELEISKIGLSKLVDWEISKYEIKHNEGKYFNVIGVNVEISNREVTRWQQPLIEPAQEGICAFIIKEIKGKFHFLVQAKLECGNFDVLEMAPTVQCLTGNYRNKHSLSNLPYLDYILNVSNESIIYDTLQSEEGGRFYREQNRNLLVLADENFDSEVHDNYIWMTLNQIKSFIKYNNYLNIQARSLISAIQFV